MSFGNISTDNKPIWGAAAYTNQPQILGRQDTGNGFKDALETAEEESKSFGFGAKGEGGGTTSSISAMIGSANDMLSQLQFSLLKNNSEANGNSLNSRMSNTLF